MRSAAEIGERVGAGLEAAWAANRERGAPLREMVAEILAKAPHSKNWQVRSRLPMKDKPSQRQVNRVIASLKKGDAKPSCPTVERTTIVMQDKPPQPSRTLVLSRYRRSRDLVRVPVDEFDPLSAYKDPAPREDQIWEPESN